MELLPPQALTMVTLASSNNTGKTRLCNGVVRRRRYKSENNAGAPTTAASCGAWLPAKAAFAVLPVVIVTVDCIRALEPKVTLGGLKGACGICRKPGTGELYGSAISRNGSQSKHIGDSA